MININYANYNEKWSDIITHNQINNTVKRESGLYGKFLSCYQQQGG